MSNAERRAILMAKKVMRLKCPECDTIVELPDDPRIGELRDTVEKQNKLIERLVDRLEESKKGPPDDPKPKKTKKQKVVHDGPIWSIEDEEETVVSNGDGD